MGKTAQAGVIAVTLAALLTLLASCGAPEEPKAESAPSSEAPTTTNAEQTPAAAPVAPPKPPIKIEVPPSAPPGTQVAAAREPGAPIFSPTAPIADTEPQPQNAPPVESVPKDGEPAPAGPATADGGVPLTVDRASDSGSGDSMFSEPLNGPESPSPPNDGPRAPETSAAAPNGESDCIEQGIEANCTNYEKILGKLVSAWTAYTCPKKMRKGRAYSVKLVLDRTKTQAVPEAEARDELAAELGVKPDEAILKLTKVARSMSASLIGASFEITPATPQELNVTDVAPVRWTWRVVPTQAGPDQELTLTLSVHIGKDEDKTKEVQIKTLVEHISVDVSTWETIMAMAPTVQTTLTLGASVLTALSAFAAWLYGSKIAEWLGLKKPQRKTQNKRKKKAQ